MRDAPVRRVLAPKPLLKAKAGEYAYWPRWRLTGPRPLSPFEAITGERFHDHRSPTDMELDRLLEAERRGKRHVRDRVVEAASEGMLDPHEIACAYGVGEETVLRYMHEAGMERTETHWCFTGSHWWEGPRRAPGWEPRSCPNHAQSGAA